jgi:hypothetical protein
VNCVYHSALCVGADVYCFRSLQKFRNHNQNQQNANIYDTLGLTKQWHRPAAAAQTETRARPASLTQSRRPGPSLSDSDSEASANVGVTGIP